MNPPHAIAILIPCKDEATSIAKVVGDFRRELPQAAVWVCDNASRDDTAVRARGAGARVVTEMRAGKGHAVRTLFSVADADVLLLVDGDDTYDAASARAMIRTLVDEHCDMVVARRRPPPDAVGDAYRRGHRWGNRAFANAVSSLFGRRVDDVFSGYRAFTRRFARSFPALSRGFEIETELTVHALDIGLRFREVDSPYGARAEGSASKLNTLADGARIALAIAHLYEQTHPARFFGAIGAVLAFLGLAIGVPVVIDYVDTGFVPRLPSAVLAASLMLLAAGAIACGIVLDSVGRGRREMKRLAYLALEPFNADATACVEAR